VFIALIGFFAAFWLCLQRPEKPKAIAARFKGAYTTLLNKYYVDELYAAVIVRPLLWLSTVVLWQSVDARGIDGAVNGVADGATALGDRLRRVQSGNTRSYAVWVVVGALLILTVIFWPFLKSTAGTLGGTP
jgi:NADH-quinone oxidoreductase subunit L